MRAALFVGTLVLLAFQSQALTTPEVRHLSNAGYESGQPGSFTLDLVLVTGSAITPAISTQQVCHNGVGDEVCGGYVVLTTSGDLTITGFVSSGPEVNGNRVNSKQLRIVRLAASGSSAGDRGAVPLGQVTVNRPSTGELNLNTASRWVSADRVLRPMKSTTTPLPEPSRWLLLGSGIAGLALASALRRRRALAALSLVLAPAALLVPQDATAQLYQDTAADYTGFANAIGPDYHFENFSSYPFNAFSNGHDFGGFIWTSTRLSADIDLKDSNLADSGLDGTLLVKGTGLPGGYGIQSDPGDDDDFRIDFDPPVQAAGIGIHDNRLETGEYIRFRGTDGSRLVDIGLPGGNTGSGSNGYRGYVTRPGEPLIASIEVNEGQSLDDDIAFDNLIWKEVVELNADPLVPRPRVDTWLQISQNEIPDLGANDWFGGDIANIGDLNGDGVVDLAVSAQLDDDGGTDRGALWILFLERDGTLRKSQKISDSSGRLSGPGDAGGVLADGDNFGRAATSLGDLDGDGTADLAVGSQAGQGTGEVFVLFMNPDGSVKSFQRINESEGGFTGSLDPSDDFGIAVDALPDLDGDGVPELAVGARDDDDAGTDAGAVYILFLDSNGMVKSHQKITEGQGGFTGDLGSSDYFGFDLTAIGDLDRDGIPDLAVTAPRDDDGATDQGAVWILFLNIDGTVRSHAKIAEGTPGFDSSITVGGLLYDLNAQDRFGTGVTWIPTPQAPTPGVLVVGADLMDAINPFTLVNYGKGAVFFLALDADGSVARGTGVLRTVGALGTWVPGLFNPTAGESEYLGIGVANLGDLDGDGFPDLAAGAQGADVAGATDVGAVYVMFLDGLDPTAFADAVTGTSGNVSGASNALGDIDSAGAFLSNTGGGTLTVQFVNNALRPSGDTRTDLVVHRTHWYIPPPATDTSAWTVRISQDGKNYTTVFDDPAVANCLPNNTGCTNDQLQIDIDAASVPQGEYRFVQIQQPEECTTSIPTLGCQYEPKVDAVEAVENLNFVLDTDYDGFADGYDVCPLTYDPGQEDRDGDGVGDFCDNCIDVPNTDQHDGDGNGKGNACDFPTVILIPVGTPSDPVWELRMLCGGHQSVDVTRAGIVLPATVNPASAVFGGPDAAHACNAPTLPYSPPNQPPGYAPSNGCANANPAPDLGPSVDAAGCSGAIGPGLSGPGFARDDTMYVSLYGQGCGASPLCLANQETILGRLYFDPPASGDATPSIDFIGAGSLGLGYPDQYLRLQVGSGDSFVYLILRPLGGEPPGAELSWELCVQSDAPLNRVSFSLAPPAGTTVGDMAWNGCNSTASGPGLERTCSSFAPSYSNVSPTGGFGSRSYGPDGSQNPLMVVTLQAGGPDGGDGVLSFTNSPTLMSCLGYVTMPSGTAGTAPALGVDGFGVIPLPAGLSPIMEAYTSIQEPFGVAVDVADMGFTTDPDGSEDSDLDGVRDEADRCPFVFDPSNHLDSGGLLTTAQDGIGDDCQCADSDTSGRLLLQEPDLALMVDYLIGATSDPAIRERCSVADGIECNLLDAVLLRQALDGEATAADLGQRCERAVPPAIGP